MVNDVKLKDGASKYGLWAKWENINSSSFIKGFESVTGAANDLVRPLTTESNFVKITWKIVVWSDAMLNICHRSPRSGQIYNWASHLSAKTAYCKALLCEKRKKVWNRWMQQQLDKEHIKILTLQSQSTVDCWINFRSLIATVSCPYPAWLQADSLEDAMYVAWTMWCYLHSSWPVWVSVCCCHPVCGKSRLRCALPLTVCQHLLVRRWCQQSSHNLRVHTRSKVMLAFKFCGSVVCYCNYFRV